MEVWTRFEPNSVCTERESWPCEQDSLFKIVSPAKCRREFVSNSFHLFVFCSFVSLAFCLSVCLPVVHFPHYSGPAFTPSNPQPLPIPCLSACLPLFLSACLPIPFSACLLQWSPVKTEFRIPKIRSVLSPLSHKFSGIINLLFLGPNYVVRSTKQTP